MGGRRDHAMLLLALQTGSGHPNWSIYAAAMSCWAPARTSAASARAGRNAARRFAATPPSCWRHGSANDAATMSKPLFPSIRGERLSRDALEHLVRKHCLTASRACPTHRHQAGHSTHPPPQHGDGAAQHGVDQAVIALWLGHEIRRDDADLHPCRHADEGKGARSRRRPSHAAGPISGRTTNSSRSSKRSDYAEQPHGQCRASGLQRRPCGIIRIAALWPLCRYRHNGHCERRRHRLDATLGHLRLEEVRARRAGRGNDRRLCLRLPRHRADRAPRRLLGSWLEYMASSPLLE